MDRVVFVVFGLALASLSVAAGIRTWRLVRRLHAEVDQRVGPVERRPRRIGVLKWFIAAIGGLMNFATAGSLLICLLSGISALAILTTAIGSLLPR